MNEKKRRFLCNFAYPVFYTVKHKMGIGRISTLIFPDDRANGVEKTYTPVSQGKRIQVSLAQHFSG